MSPRVAVSVLLFAMAAVSAVAFYPPPRTSVGLDMVEIPVRLPGTLTLSARVDAGDPEDDPLECSLLVVRIGVWDGAEVLLPQQPGDVRSLRLVPDQPETIQVPIPEGPDADEILINALLFQQVDREYLEQITTLKTVSPRGIAPYARRSIRISRGGDGVRIQPVE